MNEEEGKRTCEAGELGLSSSRQRWQWTLSSWGMTVTGMCFQGWNENMPNKLGRVDEEIAYELLVYSLTFL